MRHIVIPRHGPPDVLALREAPDPAPGPGEVRVDVRAAGVNFADVMARMGLYPDAPPLPFVPGYEVSGRIDAIGPGVTNLAPGDRVVALTRFGGYATSVVTPAFCVFRIPDRLNNVDAAALPVNYLTAFLALHRLANVSEGEVVLIHGAGGGVGTAAVQLARLRGATVIGTSSGAKHDMIRQLGAAHTIDYRTANVVDEVRRLTSGRGADVILDSIGGRSFADSYRLLAPLGRLVMCGVSSIAPGERRRLWPIVRAMTRMPRFKPLSLMNRNRGVFGINLAHLWDEHVKLGQAMRQLLDEVDAGRLRVIIARTFPLEDAAAAHRYLQSRSNIGKVVLTTGT
jgi:NADPH:quinone reductase-like Zn-dependent oxidoreductase